MLTLEEYMQIKRRLLLAADAAHKIATSAQTVRYDEDTYQIVYESLVNVKTDVRRVLAELDILRGMFGEKLTAFFREKEEGANEDTSNDAGPVVPVQAPAGEGGGEAAQPHDEGTGVGVQEERPARKRRRRSNAGRTGKAEGIGEGEMDGRTA